MADYRLKCGKLGRKLVDTYGKMEKKFTDQFLEEDEEGALRLKTGKMEKTVTEAYRSIETAVVDAYQKVEDAFVDRFLERAEESEESSESDAEGGMDDE